MNKQDTDFANAMETALEEHGENMKHSVVTTDQKCPDCKCSMLIGEVIEVNENWHRYEVDVKCKSVCSPGQVFKI